VNKKIAPIVTKSVLHQQGDDRSYWQSKSYQERIAALEEIRLEYNAWRYPARKDIGDVQPGFQRVYCVIKRK
jgi:hypothetical protein